MPRIAVAVAVSALIAFSIGFNTARYTVVWDMVGGPPHASQSGQPPPGTAPKEWSTAASQPAAGLQPQGAVASTASGSSGAGEPSPQGRAGQSASEHSLLEDDPRDDTPAEEEKGPAGYEAPQGHAAEQPPQVSPPVESSAGVDPAKKSTASPAGRQLDRVVAPDARQVPAGPSDRDGQVRRLPPIDQVAPCTAAERPARPADDPITIYPTSGI
jgi:hypothetical protein